MQCNPVQSSPVQFCGFLNESLPTFYVVKHKAELLAAVRSGQLARVQ